MQANGPSIGRYHACDGNDNLTGDSVYRVYDVCPVYVPS